MQQPRYVATRIFPLPADSQDNAQLTQQLLQLPGVVEVAVFPDEGAVYCKVESKIYDDERVRAIIGYARQA